MLSLFPSILFLSPLSAFLIRMGLAGVFGYSAWMRVPHGGILRAFGIIDALIAVSLLLGVSTQLAALLGLACTIFWLAQSKYRPFPVSTIALALIMCLSLLLTGAGPFAFDLPL